MIHEDVPEATRRLLLGHFIAEELADGLDRHYVFDAAGQYEAAFRAELAVDEVLAAMAGFASAHRRLARSHLSHSSAY